MTAARTLIFPLLSLCVLVFSRCGAQNDSGKFRNTPAYNFADPKILNLPQELDEISGITYYPKDNSVFAIIDEDGILFKIPLDEPDKPRQWQFDKKRDYEDVVLKDSVFYVLVSNGDMEELRFNGDKIIVQKTEYPNASKKKNEFETLYYDSSLNKMVIMCKSCEDDNKGSVTSFFYNDSANTYDYFSTIQMDPVFEKLGVRKERIKPSAAAINPVTKELFILCSVNKLMLIFTAQGKFEDAIPLNPKIYKQPEGITFSPRGDMVISNESHEEGYGTLLLLKNKKEH